MNWLVKPLSQADLQKNSIHKPIEATYSAFEINGQKLLQIDSYGSSSRQMPGKKSQSIQIDRDAAKQLFDVLRQHFDF
ncbi:hypothetical protein [Roseisalinus antarcticus]|nr:hypothetical protein [Roseisalinus antarcticus]